MTILADHLKCTDCGDPFTVDSPHDCPGSVLDRLQHLERKTEELNSIIKSMVKVVAYSMRDQPIGRAHHSEPPPTTIPAPAKTIPKPPPLPVVTAPKKAPRL